MKVYDAQNIRNIVLAGHAGSGKTTFAESFLFNTGLINRRGTVEDHNTTSDYHELEHERTNSIFSSLLTAEYKDIKINLFESFSNLLTSTNYHSIIRHINFHGEFQ